MTQNALQDIWSQNRSTVNGWLSISSPFVAEIMAAQGYDSVTIDLQHGVVDYADAVCMFQAMRASGVTPMARVPWLDPGAVMKILDAGAFGVICPMINNRAEAAALVAATRYPPEGTRSFGPTRALFSAGADYARRANGEIVCLAMIETAEAMENLVEIVETPGLSGVYIGPSDLTLGMSDGRLGPGFDREEPEIVQAIKQILGAAKAAGIRAGLHCTSPEYAWRAAQWGFDLLTVSNDVRLLAGAAGESVARVRALMSDDGRQEQLETGLH